MVVEHAPVESHVVGQLAEQILVQSAEVQRDLDEGSLGTHSADALLDTMDLKWSRKGES